MIIMNNVFFSKVNLWMTNVNNNFLGFAFLIAGTPYEGGIFKMKLVLGKDFPTAPPAGK